MFHVSNSFHFHRTLTVSHNVSNNNDRSRKDIRCENKQKKCPLPFLYYEETYHADCEHQRRCVGLEDTSDPRVNNIPAKTLNFSLACAYLRCSFCQPGEVQKPGTVATPSCLARRHNKGFLHAYNKAHWFIAMVHCNYITFDPDNCSTLNTTISHCHYLQSHIESNVALLSIDLYCLAFGGGLFYYCIRRIRTFIERIF